MFLLFYLEGPETLLVAPSVIKPNCISALMILEPYDKTSKPMDKYKDPNKKQPDAFYPDSPNVRIITRLPSQDLFKHADAAPHSRYNRRPLRHTHSGISLFALTPLQPLGTRLPLMTA